MKARSAKAKGTKLEKFVQKEFEKIGWRSRKQPGSGIYRDFPHDVMAESPNGRRYIIECKKWRHGWRTGDKAKGGADFLVIQRDYGEACVYMTWAIFKELIEFYEEQNNDTE
jgi:hypothetical protein